MIDPVAISQKKLATHAHRKVTIFSETDCAQIVTVKVKYFQTFPNEIKIELKKWCGFKWL